MSINPNIDGSTVDPRWIDGGPGNTTPTFNIDDPTMWTPMTVISGLASGLCERANYVKDSITGFPAGLSFVNEVQSGHAGDTAQVSKTANNIALHGGTATLFTQTSSPFFQPPGSAASNNYMESFDSALVCLIQSGGYVTKNGATVGFNDWALSASARAGSNNSSMQDLPTFGGNSYTKAMYNAFPAEWAKERKWMLDELKYTMGQADTAINTISVVGFFLDDEADTLIYSSAYSYLVSSGILWTDENGNGRLTLVHDERRSYIEALDWPVVPFAITMYAGDLEERPEGCSAYLDAPYGNQDTDIVRQYLASHCFGSSTVNIKFGDGSSYVVLPGATVTFNANLGVANLKSEGVISNAVFTPSTVIQDEYDSERYIMTGAITGGTITSGALGIINATSLGGLVLGSSVLTHAEITTATAPVVGNTYTCTLEQCVSPELTITTPLNVVNGHLSRGTYAGLPYKIQALTIYSGGHAKLCPDYVRGEKLNVYDGAKVELVTAGGERLKNMLYIAGTTVSVNSKITELPTVFRSYYSNNKFIFSANGQDTAVYPWYSRAVLICSGGGPNSADLTPTINTGPGFFITVGGTYSNKNINSFIIAKYGTAEFSTPVIVIKGATININEPSGQYLINPVVLLSGGIADSYANESMGVGARHYMVIKSGGIFNACVTNTDYDGCVGSCTLLQGGTISVYSAAAYPDSQAIPTSESDVIGALSACSGGTIEFDSSFTTAAFSSGGLVANGSTRIFPDVTYYALHGFGVQGVSCGWNILTSSGYDAETSRIILAGTLDETSALANVRNTNITSGGVVVKLDDSDISTTMDYNKISRIVEGISCYAQEGPPGVVNHYSSFRCRQFYVDPDSRTQTT